jgi:hypothetical protein
MDFDTEYTPDSTKWKWWVATPIRGTVAVGGGKTVWEALTACIEDIPNANRYCDQSEAILALARQGKAHCGCGALLPKLAPDASFWAYSCRDCSST